MANCIRRTTRTVSLLRRSLALACAAAFALPALARPSDATFSPPQPYYLALGDSVAYGFQFAKLVQGLSPSAHDTGYVDAFAARLRGIRPGITVVNYSCPGESTASFLGRGGCPWTADGRPLHDPYTTAQRHAAVVFMRAHRGQVSPITLTMWGNDVSALVNGCDPDLTCAAAAFPAWLRQTRANLDEILADLTSTNSATPPSASTRCLSSRTTARERTHRPTRSPLVFDGLGLTCLDLLPTPRCTPHSCSRSSTGKSRSVSE